MGIIFKPYYDNAPDIIIGGVKDSTAFAGGNTGVTGPFPHLAMEPTCVLNTALPLLEPRL